MAVDFPKSFAPRLDRTHAIPLGPLALLAIGVPSGIWWFVYQLGSGGTISVTFAATAVCFVILAMIYLGLHGLRNLAWTSIPVLLTFEILVYFVIVPSWQLVTGDITLDSDYVLAMFVMLVGFAGFWIASAVFMKESGVRFVPTSTETSSHVLFASMILLGLGVIGRVVLWKLGLFGYGGDEQSRTSHAGILAWIDFMSGLLNYALVVSAIEVFGKRSPERAIKVVFWLSLLVSVGFGVLSGMKSGPLAPLITIALIYGITKRRVPRSALLLPLVLVFVIYPFVSAFRANMNNGYRAQFNSIGGMEDTLAQSFDEAFFTFGANSQGAAGQNLRDTKSRLSYLTYVHDICSLPNPLMLQGDDKLWMAPIYPLVPRFIWKSKPILGKGGRLSVLLGRPSTTASAPTPIGDLYSAYGTYGVVVGMFVWGACLQLYMNWVGGRDTGEKGLFIYMLLMPTLLNFEMDFTSLIAANVQTLIMVGSISFLTYGRSPSASSEQDRRLRYSPQT